MIQSRSKRAQEDKNPRKITATTLDDVTLRQKKRRIITREKRGEAICGGVNEFFSE